MTTNPPAFDTPTDLLDRPEVLHGSTYFIKNATMPDGKIADIHLTVNELDGRVFEVFLQCRDAGAAELLGVVMILISKLLRRSVPLREIAADLEQVVSANTAHYANRIWFRSLVARIGYVLANHEAQRQATLDTPAAREDTPA